MRTDLATAMSGGRSSLETGGGTEVLMQCPDSAGVHALPVPPPVVLGAPACRGFRHVWPERAQCRSGMSAAMA